MAVMDKNPVSMERSVSETGFFVLDVRDLGLIDYEEAYALQKSCVEEAWRENKDFLLLCEHPAVLTLGRLATQDHILAPCQDLRDRNIKVLSTDRGGEVTLHAPGQLVVYPILHLENLKRDLKWYLSKLEQVAIDLLGDFGIVATRMPEKTGVWVGQRKIASVGIGVKRWVTFHGIAINVATDLGLFGLIRPCGLNVEMTSVCDEAGRKISMETIKESFVHHFRREFDPSCR